MPGKATSTSIYAQGLKNVVPAGQSRLQQGEPTKDASLMDKAQARVDSAVKAATTKRVELSKNYTYTFPSNLERQIEDGGTFMRFVIEPIGGGNKVDINIYQPIGITVSDGANYQNFDLGNMASGLDFAKNIASGRGNNVSGSDVLAAALIAKNSLSGKESGFNIRSKAALAAGVATNPYTRTTFETVNIRTFSFNFKLVADDAKEAETAKAIERTFRKFLYPKRAGALALSYPPLFRIEFHTLGEINPYMPNIKPCYLTSLESTFNETANTFHSDGSPIEVNLSLGFQEERALLRDDLYANDDTIDESPGFSSITTAQTVKGDD